MKSVQKIESVNKQSLSVEEMEAVGGGFILQLLGGAASLFVGALYGIAQTVQVGFFGLPDMSQYSK